MYALHKREVKCKTLHNVLITLIISTIIEQSETKLPEIACPGKLGLTLSALTGWEMRVIRGAKVLARLILIPNLPKDLGETQGPRQAQGSLLPCLGRN